MESGTRNECRRPRPLEPAGWPADGGDSAEVEGMDRGPAEGEAAGAGWREFPAELVPVDTGRPGPAPGVGGPVGQTSHHQCVQSLEAVGPLAVPLCEACRGPGGVRVVGPHAVCTAAMAVAPWSPDELCWKA